MNVATARRRWERGASPPRRRLPVPRGKTRAAYLFITPWVLGFIALLAFPMGYALVLSFSDANGLIPRWQWIGISNYSQLIQDSEMWWSLSRTLFFMGIVVPLSIAGGTGLALLLNRKGMSQWLFRTIFYLPAVTPVVVAATVWKVMFDRDAGVVNAILGFFNHAPITWLIDPTAFLVLVVMALWGLGTSMVISLAGLQGVPQELKEAASIDGANALQIFRHVVLPLLTPVILFELVTGVIFSLQTMVQPMLLAQSAGVVRVGQVPHGNYLYMVNVYQQVFENQDLGYGLAMLWLLFAVILVITLVVFRSSGRWVYYQVDPGGAAG